MKLTLDETIEGLNKMGNDLLRIREISGFKDIPNTNFKTIVHAICYLLELKDGNKANA